MADAARPEPDRAGHRPVRRCRIRSHHRGRGPLAIPAALATGQTLTHVMLVGLSHSHVAGHDQLAAGVLGDGYIVARYAGLPADKLAALRQFTASRAGDRVVAGPIADQTDQLVAVNAYGKLTCAEADLAALKAFRDAWVTDPRSRTG